MIGNHAVGNIDNERLLSRTLFDSMEQWIHECKAQIMNRMEVPACVILNCDIFTGMTILVCYMEQKAHFLIRVII